MKRVATPASDRAVAVAVMAALTLVTACGQGETRAATGSDALMPRVDLEAAAANLVDRAAVREGDLVLIGGSPRDVELLENVYVHARMRGADAIVIVQTDRMERRSFDDVIAAYDTLRSGWTSTLNETATVLIWVDPRESLDYLAHVPPERVVARQQANSGTWNRLFERNVRSVFVGDFYPIEQVSSRFGMPRHELARIFWDALTADPAEVATRAARLKQILEQATTVHITHPNGTDLRTRIGQFPVFANDGLITRDKEAAGGAAVHAYLPAGDVGAAVVEGSGDGRVVIERAYWHDQEIRDITLEFRNGRLVSMTAPGGLGAFGEDYALAPPGKDWLANLNFGINPAVPGRLLTWIPAGMVTISIGGNAWAGGSNNIEWARAFHLPGATVRVDDRVIIENGELRM